MSPKSVAGWPDLSGASLALRWGSLLTCSASFGVLLTVVRLPAALLLGPMLAAILLGMSQGAVRVWPLLGRFGQAVIGCMIARTITPAIAVTLATSWPLLVMTIFAVILFSALLGIGLARMRVLPGSTAIWGASPGGATAIVLMADAFGADARLVAFMQYLRVVVVAILASTIARLEVGGAGGGVATVWFPSIAMGPFAATLAIAGFGAVIGLVLRSSAGSLLLPLGLAALLQDSGWLVITLPPWLLAVSYAFVGWGIGMSFTRDIVARAARSLPRVFASIVLLILMCGVLALLLVRIGHVTPLTAYLATSPGGADAVAIIAASSNVNLPFVMAMQTARFVVVLFLAAPIARWGARIAGVKDE